MAPPAASILTGRPPESLRPRARAPPPRPRRGDSRPNQGPAGWPCGARDVPQLAGDRNQAPASQPAPDGATSKALARQRAKAPTEGARARADTHLKTNRRNGHWTPAGESPGLREEQS
eukprot:15289661-Alexandrium_andersonii.AAC.1